MSDAPEVGVASYNPSRTEVSNFLANGQHHSSMEAEVHRGMDSQSSSDIDSAGPLTSSSSTSVAQGEKLMQRQREPIKSSSLMDSSAAAPMKTIPLNQDFPSEKVETGQGSPVNLTMNMRSAAPLQMNQNSDNKILLNAVPPGPVNQSSSVSSMPSSNGPPEPALDTIRRSPMLTQPSNSPGNKMSSSPVPSGAGPVPSSKSVRPVLTSSVPSSQGAAYSSSPSVLSSQPSPARQLIPGVPPIRTSLPNSTSGPVAPQSLAAPIQTSSGAFKPPSTAGPFPSQPSAGSFPSQPSAGPFQTQSMAPHYQTQPSSGQFLPQPGPYPPQSMAGPSQPSSVSHFQPQPPGQFPPQSSSGPFPTQSSAGHFAPQYPTGQFQPLQSASGPFPAPVPSSAPPMQSSGPFPPPSSVAPSKAPPQPYGSFPPNNSTTRPPMPQPPGQPFNPQMPQPPPGQPFNPQMPQPPPGQPFNPQMPQPPGQHFSPPMPSQFPPQSSNAFPGPPGLCTPPSTSYGGPSQQPSQYIPGPQPNQIPPPGGPYPVAGGMPPRQPLNPQYTPRPPPQTATQSGGWAQANGIPNQPPSMDTITRQPVPSGVPMYSQGPQQVAQGTQPSAGGAQPVNDSSQFSRRYPQQQQQQQTGYQQYPSGTSVGNSVERMSSQFRGLSVARDGFNKLWGADCYDLLQSRYILPAEKVAPPKVQLHQEYLDGVNCRPEIFRCTLTKIPETNSLLQKSRLPLGILIHPFKDVNVSGASAQTDTVYEEEYFRIEQNLPVVQCNNIVRCRACRTYINPFVYFVDHRRWKCNLCFRVNEMPEEFQFDPVTKTYGDPSRRPEIRSATIEYIAPSEYMLRPPQAAVYLFLLDVSCGAVELGYLHTVCDVLSEELSQLPGDSRTQIGFIAYDSALHFFVLAEGLSQPQHLVVSDTTEVFLPRPDNLLVNLQECKDLAQDLLAQLPSLFLNSHDTGSALGPALQAAYKLMVSATGGRVTVFQTCLPSVGAGALKARGNDGSSGKEAQHINPATDFYKRLALDCSGQQIAVDLFVLGKHYTDLATLSGVSQFLVAVYIILPHFDGRSGFESSVLERSFHRYLSRKIGFEAVMRIRCSRGLSIHTFHGHFFVRSTDLLSLPNVNPDAGYGMQVAIDESLSDLQNVCFQAALLYTSSKGERRIRVHTLCLPLAANVNDVVCAADQQCIVGLLAKMAVDRCHQSSPSDARDAFINVATDVLSTYRLLQTAGPSSGLLAPHSLRLLPLYILALLKHVAFRAGQGTRLDERVFAMCQMKCLPLSLLMQEIYPDFYPIHNLGEEPSYKNVDGLIVPCPPRYHLSAEKLDSRGVFLMDRSETIIIYVGRLVSPQFCQDAFGVPHFAAILDDMYELPVLENPVSELLNNFIRQLQSEKPYEATIQIIREDSRHRMLFIEKLVEDRSESALSYYEFLQHLKAQVK